MKQFVKKYWGYAVLIAVSICFIGLSFCGCVANNNWSNVLCGIGTGMLTSTLITIGITIILSNNVKDKERINIVKRTNSILGYYEQLMLDINETLILQHKINWIATLRTKECIKTLEDNNFEIASERKYRIELLLEHLTQLCNEQLKFNPPKQSLAKVLIKHANEDLKSAINFNVLHKIGAILTILIDEKIVNESDVLGKENTYKDYLNDLYYQNVYIGSDEWVDNQIEEAERRNELTPENADEQYTAEYCDEIANNFIAAQEEDWRKEIDPPEVTFMRYFWELNDKNFYAPYNYDFDFKIEEVNKENKQVLKFLLKRKNLKIIRSNEKIENFIKKHFGLDWEEKARHCKKIKIK
ncbi:MAG: hypothetical protein RR413_04010 [Christensenellaceae bacterium]